MNNNNTNNNTTTKTMKTKKYVVIGGGTGSYTVLRGLKELDLDISAIVSMFDNGGSTGILRDEYGVLPPGDIRRALIALSSETELMKSLFSYRFEEGKILKGHNLGNLILLGLSELLGSDEEAIKQAAKILKIKGKVLPVSLNNSHLHAILEDGTLIKGETNIDIPKHNGKLKILKAYLEPSAKLYDDTKQAILEADVIVIGPGDLYTSIIPNLLVEEIKETLQKTKAIKMYVCNLMTKYGETYGFSASDHVKIISSYLGTTPNYVICNNHPFNPELLKKYAEEYSYPVVVDKKKIEELGCTVIEAPLIGETLVRHNSIKLASVLSKIKQEE